MSDLVPALAASGGSAVAALLVSPYLAGFTISVPERAVGQWWRARPSGGARWAVTAAVAAVFAALAGAAAGWTAAWPAYLALALGGAVLALVDVEHHRLPDRILAPVGLVAAVVFALVAGIDSRWHELGRAALAAAAIFAVLTAVVLVAPAGLGFGDVKLAAVVAGCLAWRSWRAVGAGLLLGVLLAGVAAVVVVIARRGGARSYIPLGPFLVAAALIVAATPR